MAVCTALIAAAVGASTASAHGLITGFTDNNIFDPSAPPSVKQQEWLDRAVATHSRIIRITVDWRNRLRGVPRHPTNPNDPAYGFAPLDQTIRDAEMRGLQVVLTVNRAPNWAEGANPPPSVEPGVWKPDPVKYGQFAQALATRYSGHYHGLPRVRYFEAWTEPNLTQFLAPQWIGKKPFAPARYRGLLNRFYLGVHTAQPDATVIAGAVAPFGDSRKHQVYPTHPRMRPIAFLRGAFCLNAKFKRAKSCNETAHLDAVSAHPLNVRNGPQYKPHNKDDIQVANFGRVRKVLHAAERAKTVEPSGKHSLWVTESGVLSDPPNPKGVPPQKQARWIEESLYLLWKQGASFVLNLNIRDDAYDPHHVPAGQWTTGIYTITAKPKPAVRAWRFPFVTNRKSKSKVQAWGKAPASGKLKIQKKIHKKHHKHWRTVKRIKVSGGQVFKRKLRVHRKAKLRARIGQSTSLTWTQGR